MIRVVLDTNVWISAINFDGKPEEILKLAVSKKISIFSSQTLFAELIGVLRKKFDYSDEKIREVETLFKKRVKFREPRTTLKVIVADLSDNRVLECAVEVEADFIISGDKHLLALGKFEKIKVVSPAQFLKEMDKN